MPDGLTPDSTQVGEMTYSSGPRHPADNLH
jgi:hypothetical protein